MPASSTPARVEVLHDPEATPERDIEIVRAFARLAAYEAIRRAQARRAARQQQPDPTSPVVHESNV